jgi:DNA-binding transcriptional LysR family regulator
MDMEGLHSFIAVAREKSISKAAQSLHVTQPTLSARLRKLEEGLGVTLLERGWEGVRLTRAGQLFLSYSVSLLRELQEAAALLKRRAARELDRPIEAVAQANRLRIGIESFFYPAFLKPVVAAVREVVPEAECQIVREASDHLLERIGCDALDLCIHLAYKPPELPHSVQAMTDGVVLLVPRRHYPRIRDDLSNVSLLKEKPFVLFEHSPLLRFREVTEKVFHYLFGVVPDRFHIVSDVTVTVDIVAGGFGYTFVPLSSIAHLLDRPLPFQAIRFEPDFLRLLVFTTWSASASSLHPVGAIAEAIRDRLREQAAAAEDLTRLG